MKRRISWLMVCALVLLTTAPSVAVEAQSARQREAIFCAQLGERQRTILDGLTNRLNSYVAAFEKQTSDQVLRRQQLDERLMALRIQADEKRASSYVLMENNQVGEEEKSVARTYAEKVTSAVQTRRAAFDQARISFQQTIDSLLAERDQAMREAMSTFQQAVNAALSKAAGQCSTSRADISEARRQLVAALKQARLNYNDSLQARQDYRSSVRDAAAIRNAAFKVATESFQLTMQQLRTEYQLLP